VQTCLVQTYRFALVARLEFTPVFAKTPCFLGF
jgi:hypothetical protein